jgi:hypothetical protein
VNRQYRDDEDIPTFEVEPEESFEVDLALAKLIRGWIRTLISQF